MTQFLYLSSGVQEAAEKMRRLSTPRTPIKIGSVYGRDLDELDNYNAILISIHVDQRRLAASAATIAAYLESGGTIVANGHIAYPYLPQLTPFQPIPNYRLADLIVYRHIAHPIWEGVATKDLSQRRGVGGFYARGWHSPPAGAQIIHSIGDTLRPVDFIYRVGAGRVLFHGGNDLWSFADPDSSTACLAAQLFDWLWREDRNP